MWRIAVDSRRATGGQHTIEVRAYGTERTVAFDDAFTAFALR